jgi:hypothetical protein
MRYTNNPIIPGRGICDPHVHVFDGRAYLYASHDRSPDNPTWLMDDWEIWSSGDLIEWRYESTVRPEDTYLGKCEKCWAVDAAARNGKYYLYVSNGRDETAVLVSDRPDRGFRDVLGGPLLPKDLTDTYQYDPTVFIDDDPAQTPYLIWGCGYYGSGYKIARLNEDMVSLAEAPRTVQTAGPPPLADQSFLHKRNSVYYLSWNSHYATATNVYGPYTDRGCLGINIDHGSFFEWKNQWYFAHGMLDRSLYFRASGLVYVHYRADGSMAADQMILNHGVGRYDGRWNQIEAEWFVDGQAVGKQDNHWSGFDVSIQSKDAYLHYPNVQNVPANAEFHLFGVCSGAAEVVVEIREGSVAGPVLGELAVPSTDSWKFWDYRLSRCRLRNDAGSKDLYLTFRGEGPELLRITWFRFRPEPVD